MKTIQNYTAVNAEGILLNANENSHALPDEIRKEILEAISTIDFNRYPDSSETALLEAYGKRMDLDPAQLLAGNGSDQMLGYLIGTFLGKGKTLCTLSPDFSMYDYYASSYEADVIKFKTNEDGSFDIEEFIAFAKENKADMVLFSNPNNPSGHALKLEEIEVIAQELKDIPVVIDEAYMEFADEDSAISLIGVYPDLYVTRTLSKAYGMAGIRIGFLIGTKENMENLRKSFIPFALNSVSMQIGCVILKHADVFEAQIEDIKAERQRVYETLEEIGGITVYPSQTNFLYAQSAKKQKILDLLKENNIVIRDYKDTDNFRITIGTKEENDLLLNVMNTLKEEL